MKKKRLKIIGNLCCIAMLIAVSLSLLVVPSYAWTWTNSEPRNNYAYGTNSYALAPLTSAEMSRQTTGGYKTYTYNSPSEVSFEYGNGFTAGNPLGRQITVNQDSYMSIGIAPYLSTYNTLFQTSEVDYSSSFVDSYLPLVDSLDATAEGPRTQLDYQTLSYNTFADENYGFSGSTSASFHFGSSFFTTAQIQYGGLLIIQLEVASPYSDVISEFREIGLEYSFDYVVYNTSLEAFQCDSYSDKLTVEDAYRVDASERVVTTAGITTTIPTTRLYFDVYSHVYDCPGISSVDIPGTDYNPSVVGTKATPIAIHNLAVDTINDIPGTPSSSVGSLRMYMASLRPYSFDDESNYDGLSIWSDCIQKAYHNVGLEGGGSGGGIIPEGNFEITENGSYNVTNFATVTVDVQYQEPEGLHIGPLGTSIGNAVEGVFSAEIFPNVYLWTLLLIPFSLGLVFAFIKYFAGG